MSVECWFVSLFSYVLGSLLLNVSILFDTFSRFLLKCYLLHCNFHVHVMNIRERIQSLKQNVNGFRISTLRSDGAIRSKKVFTTHSKITQE